MKGRKFLTLAATLAAVSVLTFGNGLNLNSLGTRALSMGGAYVGLANDFSAVFWNPAGLARMTGKTFGFYGTDIIPSGSYLLNMSAPALTLVDAKTQTKNYLGGLAAYVHPISDRLVAAIGVYTPSGLGSNWNGADMGFISGGATDLDWSSKVGLVTIAPSLAYKVNETLSLGASLNINYGMFDLAMYGGAIPGLIDLGQYSETETGWGLGATFGLQFKPHKMISIGAVLRTGSTVKFSGEAEILRLQLLGLSPTSDMKREVTWPMWIAGGIAFTPTDKLTITTDIQYTNWAKIQAIETTYTDSFWSLLMTAAGKNTMPLLWENTIQVRFGAEYLIAPTLAIRAGYYNDPAPAPDRTMNILLPNYDFNVLTFGFGYQAGALSIDFGLEYLMGKERSIDLIKTLTDPAWADAMPGVYNMKIIAPNLSISYRF